MDDQKEFIRDGLMALIRNTSGDDSEAIECFNRALEIKTQKIIDQITINSDWDETEEK